MNAWYTEYGELLARIFPGRKVQKISIDAGHNCPNRDGTLGRGGCLYCNNAAFSPAYCHTAGTVAAQIEQGRAFFARKYPTMQYLVYFQAYTSTHAPFSELRKAYEEAMAQPGVCGLVIGTRPDCMSDELLEYLERTNRDRMPVMVEYGVETLHDTTLKLINRHHTAACAMDTIRRTVEAGLSTGVHLIMGLPGETCGMMLQSVKSVCEAGISSVKFHQLQVIKGTPLFRIWEAQRSGAALPAEYVNFPPVNTFSLDEYLELCAELTRIVPHSVAIERFTAQCPASLLASPCWGLKNHEFVHRLHKLLQVTNF